MLNIKNATLTSINFETSELIRQWRNKDRIRKMMFNQDVISEENHKKWLKKINNSKDFILKVFYYEGTPAGVVTFKKLNNFCYEWGFYIGEEDAPKGLGTLLGIISIDYFFKELKKEKLYAEVLGFNEISKNFHIKLGFNEEGCLRKQHIIHNKKVNIHLFGLFSNEWDLKREELIKNSRRINENEN